MLACWMNEVFCKTGVSRSHFRSGRLRAVSGMNEVLIADLLIHLQRSKRSRTRT